MEELVSIGSMQRKGFVCLIASWVSMIKDP